FWAVKVNDGQGDDIIVQNNSTQLGTFSFDLRKITGWTGKKSITIRLFVNGHESSVIFDRVALQAETEPWLVAAAERSTTWQPHQQTIEAEYADGTAVTVRDVFHDTDALHRQLTARPGGEDRLLLSGQYFGSIDFDPASGTLTMV